eukprot:comp23610_c0_seq1/m.40161 comp23610_c0_seq1/g.40161  ORF comp23610_c0_seq1/g.40161 comp23610_c0_seq1/m.40161 type:complete len:110 (+) comp23610_c0_seq1:36-365(+)
MYTTTTGTGARGPHAAAQSTPAIQPHPQPPKNMYIDTSHVTNTQCMLPTHPVRPMHMEPTPQTHMHTHIPTLARTPPHSQTLAHAHPPTLCHPHTHISVTGELVTKYRD